MFEAIFIYATNKKLKNEQIIDAWNPLNMVNIIIYPHIYFSL